MKTLKNFSTSLVALLVGFTLSAAVFAAGTTTSSPIAAPAGGTATPSSAATPATKSADPKGQIKAPTSMVPKPPVDLVIQYVEYFNCPCTIINDADYEYLTNGIRVKVGNASRVDGIRAKVSINYYEVAYHDLVTHSQTITLNANEWKTIWAMAGRRMIRKGYGITGKIEHVDTSFIDPNKTNNRVNQKTCGIVEE